MRDPAPPDPLALQATALRYAAGDLPPAEATAFEDRLAADQAAREALAEAVRLSAAALGQSPPRPDRSVRDLVRDRLSARRLPGWLARRVYYGHPLAWSLLGAAVVTGGALALLPRGEQPGASDVAAPRPAHVAPAPLSAVVPPPATQVAQAPADDPAPRAADLLAHTEMSEHGDKARGDDGKTKKR